MTIINQMIHVMTSIFPDKFKIENVVPVYKKDDRQIPYNYRSISMLPSNFFK